MCFFLCVLSPLFFLFFTSWWPFVSNTKGGTRLASSPAANGSPLSHRQCLLVRHSFWSPAEVSLLGERILGLKKKSVQCLMYRRTENDCWHLQSPTVVYFLFSAPLPSHSQTTVNSGICCSWVPETSHEPTWIQRSATCVPTLTMAMCKREAALWRNVGRSCSGEPTVGEAVLLVWLFGILL